MALDLTSMLDPATTAVVTMELQRSVVGDMAGLPMLVEQIQPTFPAIARLLAGARAASVPIVHNIAGASKVPGAAPNYPLAAALAKRAQPREPGVQAPTGGEDVVPDIGPSDTDIRVVRGHGLSPFTGTELDAVLRRLGASTIVLAGVSLNIGIIGTSIEAVGLGYKVAIVTDGVAGTPPEYGQAVLDNTLRLVTTLVKVDDVLGVWAAG
jgi:nicotinamidase-related amidase